MFIAVAGLKDIKNDQKMTKKRYFKSLWNTKLVSPSVFVYRSSFFTPFFLQKPSAA
jgi:hypothetical protein